MNRPSFFEGTIVAGVASASAAVLFGVLTLTAAAEPVLRLLIAGMSFAYVLYLLRRSRERVGRITVLSCWLASEFAIWWLAPSIPLFLLFHVITIWLIRSLYFHTGMLGAAADLGISMLALGAAVWAGLHTDSLLLATWCFFLTQAAFVFIPARLGLKGNGTHGPGTQSDRFETAHRAAVRALRKLPST